jgi:hypothetical protein
LAAQPHWLLLAAAQGTALWLADAIFQSPDGNGSAAPAASVEPGVLQLQRLGARQPWIQAGAALRVRPRYALVSPVLPDAAPPSPLVVAAGSRPVGPPATAAGGDLTFDIGAALAAEVGVQASSAVADVPLRFSSVRAGIATVYPPHVTFDL